MLLKAYIFIETSVGTSPKIVAALRALQEVRSAERVTGPHDVIAVVETFDLQALGGLMQERVEVVPGVQRTLTCIVVPPDS